ncbi:tetratricopeptide repeat protein [Sphingomonas sp. RB1R13]|uniref:tetratricopeptide repeat protein n=1 Tax=Sphingomonas sp. RB1R13 TaxID=3096159 RepID=UPI002FC6D118
MGENIEREWDQEPLQSDLWNALQTRKQNNGEGTAMLTDLTSRGSVLSMMYLGHAHVSSGDSDQRAQGEELLIRSANGGSIEGRFQLALHYQLQQDYIKVVVELKVLADQGYSPAMYYLGRLLYSGDLGYKAIPEAVGYLRMAIDAGHLPSMALLSLIYRKEKFGLAGRIASHWLCLTKIPAFVRCMWSYPSSDRLRPYGISTVA